MFHPSLIAARLFAILAILAGSVIATSSAHADSGYGYCWQSGCNGQDPVQENCDVNAITLGNVDYDGYTLQLRYSPDCDAKWVRVLTPTAEPFQVANSNGDVASYTSVPYSWSWSNMVNGYYHGWGCLGMPDVGGLDAIWASDQQQNGIYLTGLDAYPCAGR
jgi:uncharacterized membrane protein